MRSGMRSPPQVTGLPGRANDRWKDGWRRGVLFSTMVGAAAHLVLFVAWPAWEITHQRRAPATPLVQLEPLIAGSGAELGQTGEATPAVPSMESPEVEVPQGTEGDADERLNALMELFGPATATIAQPILPRRAPGSQGRPLPPLSLDEVIQLSPRLAVTPMAMALPVIRNPVSFQTFLRNRYNPLHQQPNGSGTVSVAMWINERGGVEWTAVEQSSGHPTVDEIAIDAFKDIALFSPARSEGRRVAVSVVISVPFTAPW